MNIVNQIASLLTEDPDVFKKRVVIAVHPNFVIDAAAQAASIYGPNPAKYGPNRLNILLNYVKKFKRFISQQHNSGTSIVVTFLDKPVQLENWYTPDSHKLSRSDVVKQGMEQEQVYQIHQDIIDFINELNIHTVEEHSAGDACKDGRLQHILDGADEVVLIGGNLTGCLANTLKVLKSQGLHVKVLEDLTFDDDPKFWGRKS